MATKKQQGTGELEPGEGGDARWTWGEGDIHITQHGDGEKLFPDEEEPKDNKEKQA
jgi:hypothetical protein